MSDQRSHEMDIRVYYEDTDAGGVMYHGTHLDFAERGRTEFLRDLGFQNSDLADDFGMIFLVRKMEIEYLAPGFLDDLLTMRTVITLIKNSSFVMKQTLLRDGEPIAEMNVVLVCVHAQEKKPVKMPAALKAQFEKYLEN